jgi:hypothetical protein
MVLRECFMDDELEEVGDNWKGTGRIVEEEWRIHA